MFSLGLIIGFGWGEGYYFGLFKVCNTVKNEFLGGCKHHMLGFFIDLGLLYGVRDSPSLEEYNLFVLVSFT